MLGITPLVLQLVNMATATDDFTFNYYDTCEQEDAVPIQFTVQSDDDLLTLSEAMSELNLSPSVR